MVLIIKIIVIYLLLIFNFKITYANADNRTTIIHNGLLWVALDYYTIWKYDSDDEPMVWINVNTNNLKL